MSYAQNNKLIMSYLINQGNINLNQLNDNFPHSTFETLFTSKKSTKNADQLALNVFLNDHGLYPYLDLDFIIWSVDSKSITFDYWLHNVSSYENCTSIDELVTYYFTNRSLDEFANVYYHIWSYCEPNIDIKLPFHFNDTTQYNSWSFVNLYNINIRNVTDLIISCIEQRQYKILAFLCQSFIKQTSHDDVLEPSNANYNLISSELTYPTDIDELQYTSFTDFLDSSQDDTEIPVNWGSGSY